LITKRQKQGEECHGSTRTLTGLSRPFQAAKTVLAFFSLPWEEIVLFQTKQNENTMINSVRVSC